MTVYLITCTKPAITAFFVVAGDEEEAIEKAYSSDKNLDYPKSDFKAHATLDELEALAEDADDEVYKHGL
jgi:hypothetical protein